MKNMVPKNTKNYPLLTNLAWQDGNSVEVFEAAESAYPAMLSAVGSATHRAWIANYCHRQGHTYDEFLAALIAAAQRGVDVRILFDHHGSDPLTTEQANALKTAGVKVTVYHPLRRLAPWRYNKRLHKKILITDETAFTGGVGIADFWTDPSEHYPVAWRDTHFKLEGPAVGSLAKAFVEPWNRFATSIVSAEGPTPTTKGTTPIAVTDSPVTRGLTPAAELQLQWITTAAKRITLTTAYFTPTAHLMAALAAAVKRGVTVTIICNGPYHTHPIAQRAGQVSYAAALAAGIAIYEYQPTKMHAKLIVIDDRYSIVGSPNLNTRSSYHDEEIALSIDSTELAAALAKAFKHDLTNSKAVTAEQLAGLPWQYRLGNRIRYGLRYFF